jgi:hypothetical protein
VSFVINSNFPNQFEFDSIKRWSSGDQKIQNKI